MVKNPKFVKNKKYTHLLHDSPSHEEIVEKLIQSWEENGQIQSSLGTKVHEFIENYYNEVEQTVPEECAKELSFFDEFKVLMQTKNMQPYRTEWRIYDEETRVCGTIDMIYYNPVTQTYHMVDWKRSKKISSYGFRRYGHGPCSSLQDCNLSHYTLQLNIYKYIIEKHYGIAIYDMALAVFHPNQSTYQYIPLLDVQHIVQNIMREMAERQVSLTTQEPQLQEDETQRSGQQADETQPSGQTQPSGEADDPQEEELPQTTGPMFFQ